MKRRQAVYSILLASGLMTVADSDQWFLSKDFPNIESFLSRNKLLIAELAETIIPATESPGARDVKVEDFIIKIILNCTEVREQKSFIGGLNKVQVYSTANYNKPFEHCSMMEKIKILKHFERSESSFYEIIGKIKRRLFGASFFDQLKSLTVIGYCTSEPGATKGLAYIYLPATYDPCVSLQPGQKSWATK